MSEWKNPDGSTSVGILEDFKATKEKEEPKEKSVKKTKKK